MCNPMVLYFNAFDIVRVVVLDDPVNDKAGECSFHADDEVVPVNWLTAVVRDVLHVDPTH